MTINERLILSKLIDIDESHRKKYAYLNEPIVMNWDNCEEINPTPEDLVYEDDPYIKRETQDKSHIPEQIMSGEFVRNSLLKLFNLTEEYIKVIYDDVSLPTIQITYPLVMVNKYSKDRIDELLYTMGYVCSDNRMKSDNNIIQYKPIE